MRTFHRTDASRRRRLLILQLQQLPQEDFLCAEEQSDLEIPLEIPAQTAPVELAPPFLSEPPQPAPVLVTPEPAERGQQPRSLQPPRKVAEANRTDKKVAGQPVTPPPVVAKPAIRPAPVLSKEQSPPRPVAEPTTPAPAKPVPPPVIAAVRPSRPVSVPSTVPGLVRMLNSTAQVRWLLTGDSLTSEVPEGHDSPQLQAFKEFVQNTVERREDEFHSSEVPHFQLSDLSSQFEKRIARFSPQIVIVTCGLTEIQSRGETFLTFERNFHKLILQIRNFGAIPVVATPPWPCPSDAFHHSDELIRLEAIRACAEESAALLVDHWEHWEHSASDAWSNPDRTALSQQGIAEVVQELSRALQLQQCRYQGQPAQKAISRKSTRLGRVDN